MIPLLALGAALAADMPAVPSVDLQRWSLPVDSRGTLWTQDASDTPRGWAAAGLTAGFQHRPLVYLRDDGSETAVIASALSLSAQGAWSLGRLRAGIEVPAFFGVRGEAFDAPAALGDLGIDLKGVVLDHRAPVGLAITGRLWAPTTTGPGADWASGSPRWELGLAADLDVGRTLLALNVLTTGGPEADFGDVVLNDGLSARAGAAVRLAPTLRLGLDLAASAPYSTALGAPGSLPLEALGGLSWRIQDRFDLRLGAGRGLTGGIGTPDTRAILAFGWSAPREAADSDADRDADGVLDSADACPAEPEDRDGWQDEDGCPDAMTRLSGVALDEAGQPIATAQVRVDEGAPTAGPSFQLDLPPGVHVIYAEAPGYAPAQASVTLTDGPPQQQDLRLKAFALGNLVLTAVDLQGQPLAGASWSAPGQLLPPMVSGVGRAALPEGTQVIDVSAPGFVAVSFPAPITAGETDDLRVQLRPTRVEITREKLVISDKIFFDTNRATIKADSQSLIEEIASVLRGRPDILLVRIEGHTDSRATNSFNLTLSEQRAAAVRDALVALGVSPDRLRSVGYGETRPLVDQENEVAWEKNRRVEFFIERWDE